MALDLSEHNKTVLATLEEGDLVEFPRLLFSHWGIYVGNEEIVHFDGVSISGTAVDSSCCSAFTKCGTGLCKGSVEQEKFMKVAGQSKAKKNNDKDKTTPPLSIEEIRKNVSSKLRSTSYNPWRNNCEHCATWCRYGIAMSQQVDDAGKAVKQSIETVVVAGEKAAYIYTAINSEIDSKLGPTSYNATNARGQNGIHGSNLTAAILCKTVLGALGEVAKICYASYAASKNRSVTCEAIIQSVDFKWPFPGEDMIGKIWSASGCKSYRIEWIKPDDFSALYAKGIPVSSLIKTALIVVGVVVIVAVVAMVAYKLYTYRKELARGIENCCSWFSKTIGGFFWN